MTWYELKKNIYYWDGSLRDIYVLHANQTDWRKWIDYVNEHYLIDWFNGKTGKNCNNIDFNTIEAYWNGMHTLSSLAKVFINKTQINAHFFDDMEIENDIDPRDFNSIENHDQLIKYLVELSILLDKEVILTPENEKETILIKIYKNDIQFYSTYPVMQ